MARFAPVRFLFSLLLGLFVLLPVSSLRADTNTLRLEKETFRLINAYRQANRLPVLVWKDAIAKISRVHSQEMASGKVDFGHDGFGDRVGQLRTAMIGLKGAAENVLMTDDPDEIAARAVALWLGSPAHLHNIRGDYNYSGIGIWRNDAGTIYFTQLFVNVSPRVPEVQNTPPGLALPFATTPATYR